MERFIPAYIKTYEEGKLKEKTEKAIEMLKSCTVCPRNCKVDRLNDKKGVCRTGRYAVVSSFFAHYGEEDCLRGRYGSGTIFFSNCNLKCVFCQNYDISQNGEGRLATPQDIAEMMLYLERQNCHNINFVTPEHCVPQMLEAVFIAVSKGFRKLPIVYNTSAYDSLESLSLLDGVIDIYMPDFKFYSEELSAKYLKARDYPEHARNSIKEMQRQTGDLTFDENGIALRGVLVRHLVMPGCLEDTRSVMRFLVQEVSKNIFVNLMNQYHPCYQASKYPQINRRLTRDEYLQAYKIAREEGVRRFDERKLVFLL